MRLEINVNTKIESEVEFKKITTKRGRPSKSLIIGAVEGKGMLKIRNSERLKLINSRALLSSSLTLPLAVNKLREKFFRSREIQNK